MTEPIVTPAFIIADMLDTQGDRAPESSDMLAERILAALNRAGVEVIAPQDIDWGTCPDNGGDAHHVSTDMCVYCLQYNPE